MDISSPVAVSSIPVIVFAAGGLFATGSKQDGPPAHD
jgi:hypothetical protein